MLVAAAVCPHPPLLVPELAGTAASELDDLRTACAAAIGVLRDAGADEIVVVGGADRTATYGADAAGSLAPWGVDVRSGVGEPVLPLSLSVGRWLLGRGRLTASGFHAISFGAAPGECASLGGRLAATAGRVAMLVMADGSACLTEKSPGYLDPRAKPYDRAIVEALARAEVPALDPGEAAELWVAGRAALQVLGGCGGALRGEILYDDAPYGVGYFVARWTE
ncbi:MULTISPECIES: class III extradiol dioxygenase subunit B-like domain-containing protein [unclassified Streptosporangium]|uniref:class III extradiol dioxygenase subunit B-like domain-containing protein n=1 Tax=unclassified Streptosporangium TaxID=2632669 RepID=UPI002E28C020|nr:MULTISPECIES: class III extradiol dioxygenase subunit B-like domain-containing protein [unclassified Streptosporangium]